MDIEVPEPEPGQSRVRTLFSGISSGTEMLAYRGELDPSLPLDESIGALGGTFEYPFEYGYSAVGVVETPTGDIEEGRVVFSFQPHRSHFVASFQALVPVDDVDPREATLFPLVETALQISLDAGDTRDQLVLVFGLGAVGILAAAMLVRDGANVVAVDPLDWRRAAAAAFGVEAFVPEEIAAAVDSASEGEGAATIVEASGNPNALREALPLLRHEGEALVCSWFGEKDVPLPLGREFHRRRLTIRSSQVSTIPTRLQDIWTFEKRRDRTVQLMSELPLGILATHTFSVEDAAAAYAAIDNREPGLIHAALSYG